MPRPPDPNSKTTSMSIKFKTVQEPKVKWFRLWCRKNNKVMRDIIFEKIEELAKEHNYPFGHSQTEICEFEKGEPVVSVGEPEKYKLCWKSRKVLDEGMFYCELAHFWRVPVACERCKSFRKERGGNL